jgi:hypothetical protein
MHQPILNPAITRLRRCYDGHATRTLRSTVRKLAVATPDIPTPSNSAWRDWLAGVTDGDGNFDFRGKTLKAIRIKIHVRDVRLLKFIQHRSHTGRVRTVPRSNYVIWIASNRDHMLTYVNLINGRIRVKVPSFVRACQALGVAYDAATDLGPNNAYLAGLIDSDGWVSLNHAQNCIAVGVELTQRSGVTPLNLDYVIPYAKPCTFTRTTASGRLSIRFMWQNVHAMSAVLAYFQVCRLHSDFKLHRVMTLARFLTLRQYKNYPHGSVEQRLYSTFCVDFLRYQNPSWTKVPLVAKLDKDIVHKLTQSHACISTTY